MSHSLMMAQHTKYMKPQNNADTAAPMEANFSQSDFKIKCYVLCFLKVLTFLKISRSQNKCLKAPTQKSLLLQNVFFSHNIS